MRRTADWTGVCPVDALVDGRGTAALVDGRQVALFVVEGTVRAVANRDPFSGRNVLSRGLVGARGDRVVVISPLYKQAFDLATGVCVDDGVTRIAVHEARVEDDVVQVRLRPLPARRPA